MVQDNYKKLNKDELQKCELNILLELQKICNNNGLRLYLCEGTLLGAIRHKGFIPWDDDIDVCLPRPDYNKLKLLAKEGKFPEELQLLSAETHNLRQPIIKIVDKNTVVRNEVSSLSDPNADAVWIDVFPVDGLPVDYISAKTIYKRIQLLKRCLMLSRTAHISSASITKTVIKSLIVPFCRLVGAERWIALINSVAQRNDFDSSEYVGIVAYGAYGIRERMKKADFLDTCEVEFEGHSFNAIASWHNYLRQLYGDYMMLPPEEKRNVHSITAYRRV